MVTAHGALSLKPATHRMHMQITHTCKYLLHTQCHKSIKAEPATHLLGRQQLLQLPLDMGPQLHRRTAHYIAIQTISSTAQRHGTQGLQLQLNTTCIRRWHTQHTPYKATACTQCSAVALCSCWYCSLRCCTCNSPHLAAVGVHLPQSRYPRPPAAAALPPPVAASPSPSASC